MSTRDPLVIAKELRDSRAACAWANAAHAGRTPPSQDARESMFNRIRELESELAAAVRASAGATY